MSDFGICLDPTLKENQEPLTCDLPEQHTQEAVDICELEPNASDQDFFVPTDSDSSEPQLSLSQFHKQIYQDGFNGVSSMPGKSFEIGGLWAYTAWPLSLAGCKDRTSENAPEIEEEPQPLQDEPLYNEFFPQGISQGDLQRFNRLVKLAKQRGIAIDDLLPLAKEIKSSRGFPVTKTSHGWKEMSAPEQILALHVVLFLKNAEKNPQFYLAKNSEGISENKNYVDGVLKKIEEGKLAVKDISGTEFAFQGHFNPLENLLHLNRESLADPSEMEAVICHELFHFYQYLQKETEHNFEEIEVASYLKSAEYMVTIRFEEVKKKGKSISIDDFVASHWKKAQPLPEEDAIYAENFRRLGEVIKYEEHLEKVKLSVNYWYYINKLAKKVTPEVFEKVDGTLKDINFETRRDLTQRTALKGELRRFFQDQKDLYLKMAQDTAAAGPGSSDEKFLRELEEDVSLALFYGIALFYVDVHLHMEKTGALLSESRQLAILLSVYQELSEIHPARYLPTLHDAD